VIKTLQLRRTQTRWKGHRKGGRNRIKVETFRYPECYPTFRVLLTLGKKTKIKSNSCWAGAGATEQMSWNQRGPRLARDD